jgi:predicted amidophosphoribosyltransferase
MIASKRDHNGQGKCPTCMMAIPDLATKCGHCGSDLGKEASHV